MSVRVILVSALLAGPARADDDATRSTAVEKKADSAEPFDLRLTLSNFLYRQTGNDSQPLVDGGAPIESASPVRRYFGDLRIELADEGLQFDGRVRQTTGERYQSGATGGGEYDIRTMAYRVGNAKRKLVVGRQYVDAVGATKIDGAAFVLSLTDKVSGTLFGGAFPALGSRSLDTDYPAIRKEDGSEGKALIPVTGGLGVTYTTPNIHGDLGMAAVYVGQDVPGATSTEASRVFATASGYARPKSWIDIYHYALLDVAGNAGVSLTNGSLGIDAHATDSLKVSLALHHVSTDLLQIAARNVLEDPDPTTPGVVQNNIALIRVSQDTARAGTSLALAQQRFEISMSSGFHRRPAVDVSLSDGGTVTFRDAKSVDGTMTILDRRSIAKLRASLTGTVTVPLDKDAPNRSKSTVVRLAAGRPFLDDRAELTADLAVAKFRSVVTANDCVDSLDVLTCFGSSKSSVVEAGALGSYRIAREWLFLLDTHIGVHDVESTSLMGTLAYPHVLSVTVFARAQWRYR